MRIFLVVRNVDGIEQTAKIFSNEEAAEEWAKTEENLSVQPWGIFKSADVLEE